ncbi:hypothetical protein DK389_03930 [Methylobacterium durans]|uniref:Uncharacterized protein n=2 Tax=Methylobacterium durans TaxID=2202825 RepID=A0A2U8W1A2_9HYPH|nr:hypothetical protein DK389_03930 [Methylobacterium durans]
MFALPILALQPMTLRAEDAPSVRWPGADRRLEIRQPFGRSEIVLGISSRTAGAIDSLTWEGRQFINAFDHGRELQSAASFDGYGECLNPTEAGSNRDGAGQASTTLLRTLRMTARTLETESQMAFWLGPRETLGSCSRGPGPYASPRSDYTLTKRVTLGFGGVENAIEYVATFHLPRPHATGAFEVLTGYMPPDFSQFWTYDPATQQMAPLSEGPGEQPLPVILATPDGTHAMGVFTPDPPRGGQPAVGYGRFSFADLPGPGNATVKWNCVFRESDVPAGDRTFRCFTLVGTLDDVRNGIEALHRAHGAAETRTPRAERPVEPAPASGRAGEAPPSAIVGEALFVGAEPRCNAGVVTTNPGHMQCATRPIGSTVKTDPGRGAALYVGLTAGVNAGVVSTNPRHLNGDTRPIGFLLPLGTGGTRVFIGEQRGCNAGVATTNPMHLNCTTIELGSTHP